MIFDSHFIKVIEADSLDDVCSKFPGNQHISITMKPREKDKMDAWASAVHLDSGIQLAIMGEKTGIGAILLALIVDRLAEGRQILLVNVPYAMYQRFKEALTALCITLRRRGSI